MNEFIDADTYYIEVKEQTKKEPAIRTLLRLREGVDELAKNAMLDELIEREEKNNG